MKSIGALILLSLVLGVDPTTTEGNVTLSPVPLTSVGVNFGSLDYWDHDRVLANLAGQTSWGFQQRPGPLHQTPENLEADGSLKSLPEGTIAFKQILRPAGKFDSIDIQCNYDGEATFAAWSALKMKSVGPKRFTVTTNGSLEANRVLTIERMSATKPVRNLDCREADMARSAYFAPDFLSFARTFAGIRFLGWQNPTDHKPNWQAMANPNRAYQNGPEGASVQMMVALANEADVDPWFLMPYYADDTYIRNFANYVHEHLEPGRVVYVELGNEVWNWGFKTTHVAKEEGLALGLHKDPFRALLRRYAQKSTHMFDIWSRAFADNPKRLVRVVATQSACTDLCFKEILDFENTAASVDALAIAPYFGAETKGRTVADVDQIFTEMDASIDKVMGDAVVHKQLADRYGKRLIAYEGGQHIVTSDLVLARALQRDPRMGRLYTRYLGEWQRRVAA